jgi:hypothetical protein
MAWESVAHLFAKPQPAEEKTPCNATIEIVRPKEIPAWQFEIERSRDDVDGFLRAKGMIKADESWRHAGDKALARIEADPAAFLAKVREWKGEA